MVKNPIVAKLPFEWSIGGPYSATGPYVTADRQTYFHDLFKSMSIVNRKLHRQAQVIDIANLHIHQRMLQAESAPGTPVTVTVSVLPLNWVTVNAHKKAFELWKDQQQEAYKGSSPSLKPKWQDFKVYMSENHFENYDDETDLPVTAPDITTALYLNYPTYSQAEAWDYSKIVYETDTGTPVAVEKDLHVLGASTANTFGLINEYAVSRAVVFDPDPANLNPTSTMYSISQPQSVVVEELVTNLTVTNESPPYDHNNYPGGTSNGEDPIIVYQGTLSPFVGSQINTGPFQAPLGLVRIDFTMAPVSGVLPEAAAAFLGEFDCVGLQEMN